MAQLHTKKRKSNVSVLPAKRKLRKEKPITALELVIPCRMADKPDRVTPIYYVERNPETWKQRGVWQCRECSRKFMNRRSWQKHKGINWIHASGIEVCQ